jgi:hypothetical protein
MINFASVEREEMCKNTSILSEEICFKHGVYLSTKLESEWLYLCYCGCAANWSISSNCFTYLALL